LHAWQEGHTSQPHRLQSLRTTRILTYVISVGQCHAIL
jgi:hypothetical protein